MTHLRVVVLALLLYSSMGQCDDQKSVPEKVKWTVSVLDTQRYEGTVVSITKDAIMVVEKGKEPIIYPFHERLRDGDLHTRAHPATSYLPSDVKPGDFVCVDTCKYAKQTFCVALQICERPGGLVPPGQLVAKNQTYHDVRNAQIALRDKGTPIPEHLKPTKVGQEEPKK